MSQAMADERWPVRQAAAEALASIGPAADEATPALIRALADEVWAVRWAAAMALRRIRKEEVKVVPVLVEALSNEEADIRETAAEILGNIGPAAGEATPALIRVSSKDENDEVRAMAVWALGQVGPAEEVLSALIEALGDESSWSREAAARALIRLDPSATAVIPCSFRLWKTTG